MENSVKFAIVFVVLVVIIIIFIIVFRNTNGDDGDGPPIKPVHPPNIPVLPPPLTPLNPPLTPIGPPVSTKPYCASGWNDGWCEIANWGTPGQKGSWNNPDGCSTTGGYTLEEDAKANCLADDSCRGYGWMKGWAPTAKRGITFTCPEVLPAPANYMDDAEDYKTCGPNHDQYCADLYIRDVY